MVVTVWFCIKQFEKGKIHKERPEKIHAKKGGLLCFKVTVTVCMVVYCMIA